MKRLPLPLSDLVLLEPQQFTDPRGSFFESYQQERYHAAGLAQPFVQDNISSSAKGVLRGLHYQRQYPQGKLVMVLVGRIYDVAVDVRPHSPTFGQHVGVWLDDKQRHQFYLPPGFAHGFYVASDLALVQYKCTDYYRPSDEAGLMWNDDTLNIDWPIELPPILSEKDQHYPPFSALITT